MELYEDLPSVDEDTEFYPNLFISFWSFRLMIGLGIFSAALAVAGLWLLRKGRVTDSTWFSRLCLVALPMPFLASSFGLFFTEIGRLTLVVLVITDHSLAQACVL